MMMHGLTNPKFKKDTIIIKNRGQERCLEVTSYVIIGLIAVSKQWRIEVRIMKSVQELRHLRHYPKLRAQKSVMDCRQGQRIFLLPSSWVVWD